MKIAIFDYCVIPNNPIGSCHRRLLAALSREHDFTVFAPAFDNPDPDRIAHVRIPVALRPLALLFATYHVMAPLTYFLHRWRTGSRFDLLQTTECNSLPSDLAYVHFCNAAFLRGAERNWGFSLRRALRWCDHRLRAMAEPHVYRRADRIVVPSEGLCREIEREFPATRGRVAVIRNPIRDDLAAPEPRFDRGRFRSEHGLPPDVPVLLFAALGHFERKGLRLAIEALRRPETAPTALLVVGGDAAATAPYRAAAAAAGVADRIHFIGFQADVRPCLWAADGFILPSAYEACPLVVLEAAAARLPLIVTRLNGVEDWARDGENAFVVDRTAEAVGAAIARFAQLPTAARAQMGEAAADAVRPYTLAAFVAQWREIYREWERDCGLRHAAGTETQQLRPSPAPRVSRRLNHPSCGRAAFADTAARRKRPW